jgi:hypothetical protein
MFQRNLGWRALEERTSILTIAVITIFIPSAALNATQNIETKAMLVWKGAARWMLFSLISQVVKMLVLLLVIQIVSWFPWQGRIEPNLSNDSVEYRGAIHQLSKIILNSDS